MRWCDSASIDCRETHRTILLLRDIEELSTDDVAQILDLSHDVVKTRLHRGRAAMKQKLDCYVNNRCLDDQPAPSPAPLTSEERQSLLAIWKRAGRTPVQ